MSTRERRVSGSGGQVPRTGSRLVFALMTALSVAVLLAACGGSDGPELTLPAGSAAADGQQVAANRGCVSCHSTDGKRKAGPTWKGLAGSEVQLSNGDSVTADADYLARSITDPGAEIVDSFAPTMPSFDLSPDEVDALVAFIEVLSP